MVTPSDLAAGMSFQKAQIVSQGAILRFQLLHLGSQALQCCTISSQETLRRLRQQLGLL